MRHCWGAQLSWTWGKTNFYFPQSTPVLSSKQRQSWKSKKNVNPEINIYKTPSPPTIKKCGREFSLFSMKLWGFSVQKEWTALKKGHSQWKLHHLQPQTLWAKVFLDWSDKSWRCCLPASWKEELHLLWVTASTWLSLWHLQQRWSCFKKECVFLSIHRKKQKHKPSSSRHCFLVLELFCRAAIVPLFSFCLFAVCHMTEMLL